MPQSRTIFDLQLRESTWLAVMGIIAASRGAAGTVRLLGLLLALAADQLHKLLAGRGELGQRFQL
ncbi:hypothetical protein [Microbispora rosea]|uniref:hypothetical protein n=1 Tax=Microbispora rosea TaxID=58117 RepID=UPI0009712A18|nr:hypothetical protein [Microbispora rosea]